ncbi:unnamed protein product [Prunus armeniaca]
MLGKVEKIRGRDPDRWHRDALGNTVFWKLVGCPGCLCHDYDHIVPYSKGVVLTKQQQKRFAEQKLKDLKVKNYLFQALDRSILETNSRRRPPNKYGIL